MLSDELPDRNSAFRDSPVKTSIAQLSGRWQGAVRCLLLLAVAALPWMYGGTPAWARLATYEVLRWLGVLGVVMLLMRGRWLRMTWQGWLPPVLLLAWAGVAQWNPRGEYFVLHPEREMFESTGQFIPVPEKAALLPGTVDASATGWALGAMLAIFVAYWLAGDMAERREWRSRLLFAMVLSGVGLSVLGLAQVIGGADNIYWGDEKAVNRFFATWLNRNNAAAFLNFTLPLTGAYWWRAFGERRKHPLRNSLWILALLLNLTAAVVTGSRAGAGIACGIAVIGGVIFLIDRFRSRGKSGPVWLAGRSTVMIVAILLTAAAIFAMVVAFGVGEVMGRFEDQDISTDGRVLAYQACLRAIPEAGWRGFGPGTFALVFPFFPDEEGVLARGIWRYAHQDYLQGLIEWGWCGALLWVGWFVVAARRGIRVISLWHQRMLSTDDFDLLMLVLALAGVALHAMVDFPLQIPSIQLYAACGLGVLCGGRLRKRGAQRSRKKAPREEDPFQGIAPGSSRESN